ncbi:MAG: C25 family cysteine peptidase [Promethearchaeota archaeon]
MNRITFSKILTIGFLVILFISVSAMVLSTYIKSIVQNTIDRNKQTVNNNKMIFIMVNSTIYDSLNASLTQLKNDLENIGKSPSFYNYSPQGLPTNDELAEAYSLRSVFIGQMAWLEGAILIGKFPIAYYNISNSVFPCDLFYMDLDGQWTDNDNDRVFDNHTDGALGDRDPEIWIGRIDASMMSSTNEITAITNYLLKNHLYRNGTLQRPHNSLVYIDDDWTPWTSEWANDIKKAYTNQTVISVNTTTDDDHYENELTNTSYEWVHLFVHSYYDKHMFYSNSISVGDTTSIEVRTINTQPLFYLLYACSSADFSKMDNIGTEYLFSNNTLAVISSTKVGGLLGTGWFYGPLGNGECIGTSLVRWFSEAILPSAGLNNPANSYGMVILGDPSLTVAPLQQPIPAFGFLTSLFPILLIGLVILLFDIFKISKMRKNL